MTVTNAFWEYFKPILEETEPTSIQMSDADRMDRLVENSRSEELYPAIFVMRPKYSGVKFDDAALVTMFNVRFFVLCQASLDDPTSQDLAYQQAEEIVQSVVQTLQHDSRSYKCYFDFSTFTAEPIIYTTVDATYGYEAILKCGIITNEQFC